MKASELISMLADEICHHGDHEVSTGGPEGGRINNVWFNGVLASPVIYVS